MPEHVSDETGTEPKGVGRRRDGAPCEEASAMIASVLALQRFAGNGAMSALFAPAKETSHGVQGNHGLQGDAAAHGRRRP